MRPTQGWNVQQILSALVAVAGLVLMAIKIHADSEPGAFRWRWSCSALHGTSSRDGGVNRDAIDHGGSTRFALSATRAFSSASS